MAWIDARAVKLGCVGFSKIKSYRSSRYGSPLAKDVCKKANSNAHLIEIFNDNQSKFLKSEKVRKQVRTHIGIDSFIHRTWWIGAKLKNLHGMRVWYWQHSKKQVTYWSHIGYNGHSTNRRYPYGCLYLSKTRAYFGKAGWSGSRSGVNPDYPICQISDNK